MLLRMGTRGSALALAQSGAFARQLSALTGARVETVVIKTTGDALQTQPKETMNKGLFVKEIEEALLEGKIDFAVHSAKDLPGELPAGLELAAFPEREDPRDAFIGKGIGFGGLAAGHRVATSSLRRSVQLLAAKPGLTIVPMRGNVDTRLRKMAEGACDALLLAAAGLRRLGRGEGYEPVPTAILLPAPGQGSLAVECRADAPAVREALARLDHGPTRQAVTLEREFLKIMGGGCSMPLGALARPQGKASTLEVFYARPDGSGAVRLSETCPSPELAAACAASLAGRISR